MSDIIMPRGTILIREAGQPYAICIRDIERYAIFLPDDFEFYGETPVRGEIAPPDVFRFIGGALLMVHTKDGWIDLQQPDPFGRVDPHPSPEITMTNNPVQITQDADGTFIVSEPGQSPQKLTKNWADLDAFMRSQFRVYEAAPQPNPFDHDGDGKPGGSLAKDKKPK